MKFRKSTSNYLFYVLRIYDVYVDDNGDGDKNETTKLNYDLHLPNPYFRLQRFHIPQDHRCVFGSSQ